MCLLAAVVERAGQGGAEQEQEHLQAADPRNGGGRLVVLLERAIRHDGAPRRKHEEKGTRGLHSGRDALVRWANSGHGLRLGVAGIGPD